MSSSTSLADFVNAIDKLEVRGKNWVSFKHHFMIAVHQKEVWDHFNGKSLCPIPADEAKPTADEVKAVKEWNKAENTALYLLSLKIPENILLKYEDLDTVMLMWTSISNEFQQKSLLYRTTLHADFMNMRAVSGTDLHTEFNRVRTTYDELLNVGITISDGEYSSMLISFLPSELSSFISQLSTTAKLSQRLNPVQTTATPATGSGTVPGVDKPVIAPDLLMELALEEWDRQQLDKKSKVKAKDHGVAAVALSSEKLKTKGRGGPKKPVGVCWTCGGKGHKQAACPSPNTKEDKKGKDITKPPTGGAPTGTGAIATASIVEVDTIAGAWVAIPAEDILLHPLTHDAWLEDDGSMPEWLLDSDAGLSDDRDSMPKLQSVSDSSESSADDCPHCGPTAETAHMPLRRLEPVPMLVQLAGIATWLEELPRSGEQDDAAPVDVTITAAVLPTSVANATTPSQPIDLYDSGASHHMSPHRQDFVSLLETKMTLNAANQ